MRGVGREQLVPFVDRLGRLLEVLVFRSAHRLADPVSRPAGRHGEADFEQRAQDLGGAVMGAILVADDAGDRDLAVGRHAAALILLVVIAYGLFTIIPKLGDFADDLYQMYAGEVRKAFYKDK